MGWDELEWGWVGFGVSEMGSIPLVQFQSSPQSTVLSVPSCRVVATVSIVRNVLVRGPNWGKDSRLIPMAQTDFIHPHRAQRVTQSVNLLLSLPCRKNI